MKNKNQLYLSLRMLLFRIIITCGFMVIVLVSKSQQGLAVIANQKGSPPALTSKELKSVFMGEKQRWSNGTKIVIALMKTNNSLGIAVCSKVYDMKPDELNKYFLALVFQGKVSAPFFFNSVSDLQSFVAQNAGAISIIDQSVNTPEIKTVNVDGRKTL